MLKQVGYSSCLFLPLLLGCVPLALPSLGWVTWKRFPLRQHLKQPLQLSTKGAHKKYPSLTSHACALDLFS